MPDGVKVQWPRPILSAASSTASAPTDKLVTEKVANDLEKVKVKDKSLIDACGMTNKKCSPSCFTVPLTLYFV